MVYDWWEIVIFARYFTRACSVIIERENRLFLK